MLVDGVLGCFSRCGIYHSFVVQGLRALPGGRKGEPPGGLPVFTRRFPLPFLPLIFTSIFTPRFLQEIFPPIFTSDFPWLFSEDIFHPAFSARLSGVVFHLPFFLCKISTRFIGTGRTPTRPSTNLQKITRSRFLQKVPCCEPKSPLPKSHPRIPPSLIPKNLYPLKGI